MVNGRQGACDAVLHQASKAGEKSPDIVDERHHHRDADDDEGNEPEGNEAAWHLGLGRRFLRLSVSVRLTHDCLSFVRPTRGRVMRPLDKGPARTIFRLGGANP